jgi:hypothetical protein
MPEHTASHRTREVLEEVKSYITTGQNEPPSFTLSRLTDDLFTDSLLGGGAFVNPSGDTLESEDSDAWTLSPGGGAPSQFPIALSIDLATARVSGKCTMPDGTSLSPSFQIHYLETVNRAEGRLLLFDADGHADGAAYSLTLLLS